MKTSSSIEPDIPEALERICQRATAKRPKDRYATCREMSADLQDWLAGRRVRTRSSAAIRRPSRKRQYGGGIATAPDGVLSGWFNTNKRKIQWAVAGMVWLVAVAELAALSWLLSQPEPAPQTTQHPG